MRGIPDKIATREDVYNIAMDLPPIQAQRFLKRLKKRDLRRVGMTDENFQIIKNRVADARWREVKAGDIKIRTRSELDRSIIQMQQARREMDIAMLRHRTAMQILEAARLEVNRLRNKMEGLKNG